MLPNFLGIGTQRGATTWLFNCLREHPEIFVPDIKEVSFFDVYYEKGISYYESFFQDTKGYKAVGEITPDYLYCRHCPERIARHLPDVKMIVILRNPVDRAFSAYNFFFRNEPGLTFREAMLREPSLLEKGLYYEQLKRYFAYFRRDAFLILLYEDLSNDNLGTIKRVYEFLEVDKNFHPSWIGKITNIRLFPSMHQTLHEWRLSWAVEGIKKTFIGSLVRQLLQKRKKGTSVALDDDIRSELIEYFRKPNEDLGRLIDCNLSGWNQ